MNNLLLSSLTQHTQDSYRRAWQHFHSFLQTKGFVFTFPIPLHVLANFIAFLFEQEYAPGTIVSMISALSFVHKLLMAFDPTDTFVIKKMLQGCKKLKCQFDTRLPITLSILVKILNQAKFLFSGAFAQARFKAMCTLAFHALLRIGEMTASHNNLSRNCVHMDSGFLILQFLKFKHSAGSNSTHTVKASPGAAHCPVAAMNEYLVLRGDIPGPLFLSVNGSPVFRKTFANELKLALRMAGLHNQRYTSHSFLIGGASHLASLGFSELQIRQAGRWSSSAYLSYLRINQ